MVTVIMWMWRGRDVVWLTRDVPADLLSMGRKTSSFIDHCKKFRKAFWIILSQKCSWKTHPTRHLNGFLKNRTVFEKFQLKEFYCLCVVHCRGGIEGRTGRTWRASRAEGARRTGRAERENKRKGSPVEESQSCWRKPGKDVQILSCTEREIWKQKG